MIADFYKVQKLKLHQNLFKNPSAVVVFAAINVQTSYAYIDLQI